MTDHGRRQECRTANKVLPKAGANGFYETFVQGSTAVILLNFSAKNPRLRQYPKRYSQCWDDRNTSTNQQK